MTERPTAATITDAELDLLYAELEAIRHAPVLRTCIVPGCFRQYDALAAMEGSTPARENWSSAGWHRLQGVLATGGEICPDHVDLVTAHTPRRVTDTPDGWWQITCSCEAWRTPAVRWHGILRALWEEHILIEGGMLPADDAEALVTTPEMRARLVDLEQRLATRTPPPLPGQAEIPLPAEPDDFPQNGVSCQCPMPD